MAFEQIKAKLGLDVTDFERGINKANNATSGLRKKLKQEFAGSEKLGGALAKGLATAFGLSVESIGKNIGSWIEDKLAGQSKKALDQLVEDGEKAADQLDKRLAEINKERKKRDEENAKQEEKTSQAKINLGKAERDIIFAQLDDAGKIEILEQDALDALKDKINAQKDSAEYYEAETRFLMAHEEIRLINAKIQEDINDKNQDALDKEKEKKDAISQQTAELKKQGRAIQENIKTQRRQDELPTMEEVISGERNIGTVGKKRATDLDRAREKALRLSDAEQRAREAFSNAPTEGAREAALAQGKAIRSQLDKTREQIQTSEKLLSPRISDANPYSEMEKQLGQIKTELTNLNTKLEATSIR